VSVSVENAGKRSGDEVVQVYVSDVVMRTTPPVQQLRGFQRVDLEPGERRRIEFTQAPEHLGFHDRRSGSPRSIVNP
jgi:beta-glucosidase